MLARDLYNVTVCQNIRNELCEVTRPRGPFAAMGALVWKYYTLLDKFLDWVRLLAKWFAFIGFNEDTMCVRVRYLGGTSSG